MDNSTIGTIYALKKMDKPYDEAVIDFWSNLTGCPAECYNKEILMNIATNTIRDYISTANNPSYVLYELFEYMHFDCKHLLKVDKDFDDRVRDAIWTTLALTQVKDKNGCFVNGFRELEDDEVC